MAIGGYRYFQISVLYYSISAVERTTAVVFRVRISFLYLAYRWEILEDVVHDLSFTRAAFVGATLVDIWQRIVPLLPPISLIWV